MPTEETTRKRPRSPPAPRHVPPRPYALLPFHGEHKRAVSSVAFAPTPREYVAVSTARCATGSADGTAKIWDLTPAMLQSININDDSGGANDKQSSSTPLKPLTLSGHTRGINDVAWSPSRRYLSTASDDKTLRLWDASTSDALVEFKGHLAFVFSTHFSPVSDLMASGSFDSTVKLWDVRSGSCVSTLPAHSDPVTSVRFNYDGTCVASGSHDGLVRVWDTAAGQCLKTIVGEEKHGGAGGSAAGGLAVGCVTFSPNGKYLLSGSLDGKVRLWDLVGGKWFSGGGTGGTTTTDNDDNNKETKSKQRREKCLKTYRSHVNSRFCVFSTFSTVNPDRNMVISGSEDGKVYLYDLQSRLVRQTLDGHQGDAVLAVDCHDTLELIGSGGMTKDKTVRFWAAASSSSTPET